MFLFDIHDDRNWLKKNWHIKKKLNSNTFKLFFSHSVVWDVFVFGCLQLNPAAFVMRIIWNYLTWPQTCHGCINITLGIICPYCGTVTRICFWNPLFGSQNGETSSEGTVFFLGWVSGLAWFLPNCFVFRGQVLIDHWWRWVSAWPSRRDFLPCSEEN